MELREIKHQEDLQPLLTEALEQSFSEMYGSKFLIVWNQADGQAWSLQPLLSTFFRNPPVAEARRFMSDRFRYTPVRHRIPGQWVLGVAATSHFGLRLFARRAFFVNPPLTDAASILIVPGSRRIRIFDFARAVARSIKKPGYDSSGTKREIAIRRANRGGPFLPLSDHDLESGWIEEPLVDAYALPRCPPWWNASSIAQSAIDDLTRWQASTINETTRTEHLDVLRERLFSAMTRLENQFPNAISPETNQRLDEFTRWAAGHEPIFQVTTHGDFQPGNVLVLKKDRSIRLTDWEDSSLRSDRYDVMTFGLRARYPRGLSERSRRFLSDGEAGMATKALSGLDEIKSRRRALGLFLLEDLERSLTDAVSNPYRDLPLGTRMLLSEVQRI